MSLRAEMLPPDSNPESLSETDAGGRGATVRHVIAVSDHPVARSARRAYHAIGQFHVPMPRLLEVLILRTYVAIRTVYFWLLRLFVVEPILRAHCLRHGKNLRGGGHLPWITGSGDLIIGDNCNVVGKMDVAFAARFSSRPRLQIGDNTGIGHGVSFVVAKEITIGNWCHIAGGTRFFDSSGHPLDPERRRANLPLEPDEVKPIAVGDNVWIGTASVIFPGVTIGDNSVVATGSVVTSDVPPNTLVAGYPARQIKRLG